MIEKENRSDAGNIEPALKTHATNGAGSQVTPVGYPSAHLLYRDAGWLGVLPLPPRSKVAPPTGYTGREGQWPSAEQFDTWARMFPRDANICLRLDDETVGIDVDAYGRKTGAETLDEAEKRWGTLPPTVISGSRDDGVSGIRLFRVPRGTILRDRIGFKDVGGPLGIGDVEILQQHHRYVVCWPSVHPDTKTLYVWRDADGSVSDHVPVLADLPALPTAWLDGLRREERSPDAVKSDVPYEINDAATGGRPTSKVAERLALALYDVEKGHSRHDTTRDHVLVLLQFGSRGHEGTAYALE
ncbi:bifunctional DNA primase/polymerase [Mycolicibacterium aichiense]|uniref:DNA primase/polymerase bifunctional N-terminal domain-containing protein n=1 Tax=Mycolicibacterium aichiense TaxID=1799 RepID=A0AAD1HKR7_9MYCO|nr:bifunctional DNA primase/polymerase [Mycolicibacterium aichiense]MCV7017655.1 bifunctional DNA primase/polymerase [Mycolicibacterium aichiense]BBX06734.1 hypothetical protein MAIC_15370 [Mycolicibacterium aichiense]STZ23929.1 bifunctional DNA primase/polymerase famiily protein [Mycolicibacterium aichiense]